MANRSWSKRIKEAMSLEAAITTHLDTVVAGLERMFRPVLRPGEELPDLRFVLILCRRLVAQRRRGVAATEDAHFHEASDDREPRRRKNQLTKQVYRILVDIRQAVAGAFGRHRTGQLAAMRGRLKTDPYGVLSQARHTLSRLRKHQPEQLEDAFPGARFDPEWWADRLEPPFKQLQQALAEVDREQREGETTQMARARAREAYDADVGPLARLLEALLELAGEKELAEKLRPRVRRPDRLRAKKAATERASGGEQRAAAADSEARAMKSLIPAPEGADPASDGSS